MASPFKFFRKNQKAALAILTLVAMGGFVILPIVSDLVGSGGNAAAARQPVVTTTRYGDISAATLSQLRADRQTVLRFLGEIDQMVRVRQQNWRTPTVAGQLANSISLEDRSIVETWLLAQHAEELGIVVDKAAVNDFIAEIAQGVVTQEDIAGVPGEGSGILGAMKLPESQLFRLLNYELTALRVRRLAMTGMQATTPGKRWDLYKRLNRKMSVEIAELPVQRFAGSVEDPDPATLEKFFNKYKEKENNAASPEPGFQIPKRIAVEYFKVAQDQLFEPGELEKYYEEHKEEFKRETLPDAGPSESTPELKGSLPGLDGPPIELPPTSAAPSEPEGAANSPAEDSKPDQPTQPEMEGPAADEADAPKENIEEPKPAEGDSPEPKGESEEKTTDAPEPTDESRLKPSRPFQLTGYLAEEEAVDKPKEEGAAEAQKAEADKPDSAGQPMAEEKPEDSKPDEPKQPEKQAATEDSEEKAEQKPAEPEKAEEPAGEAANQTPEMSADEAKAPSESVDATPKFEAPTEYYTFDEVKSQIERQLAPEKLEKLFRPLENMMTIYHDAHIRHLRTQGESGSPESAPDKPDFAKLAAEAGIEAKKTDLFSQQEALEKKFDIAGSWLTSVDQSPYFLQYAFESLPDLRPARSEDGENYYLFWTTKQEPQRVPELTDEGVREMVVDAWKMIQARNEAQKEADRLAAKAREAQAASKEPVTLEKALADEQNLTVESTEPFTWINSGSVFMAMYGQGRISLGTVSLVPPEPKEGEEPAAGETVPLLGADFMQAVAALDEGEIGVAWNEPKTVAYIVRMVETSPDPEQLRSSFLADSRPQQIEFLAQVEKYQDWQAWLKSLEQSVGLEWQ